MFLVIVSFLKVIEHNKVFAKLSHVYSKASKEIIILAVSRFLNNINKSTFVLQKKMKSQFFFQYLQIQTANTVLTVSFFQVMFLIWIAAYTSLGTLIFGSLSVNFGLPHNAILSVVALMTRAYTFSDLEEQDSVGTKLFVVSYLILATGTITSLASPRYVYDVKKPGFCC